MSSTITKTKNSTGHYQHYVINNIHDGSSYHTTQCTNCGNIGHIARNCLAPVTSYGIIAIRPTPRIQPIEKLLCSSKSLLTGMVNPNDFEFLLIQRRDSLSFIEFIRGKYNITDKEYISKLFKNMTKGEHERLLKNSFEELWKSVWGESSSSHRSDYENSEKKIKSFNGTDQKSIAELIEENPSVWDEPEWGFPKGRRNPHESDIHCAIREFQEETNINRSEFQLIYNIQPLTETFFGSNQVHYCHKYYLSFCKSDLEVSLSRDNPHMLREIGNICWMNLDDALKKIRPDNIEKREILLKAASVLRNFCPVPSGDLRRI